MKIVLICVNSSLPEVQQDIVDCYAVLCGKIAALKLYTPHLYIFFCLKLVIGKAISHIHSFGYFRPE